MLQARTQAFSRASRWPMALLALVLSYSALAGETPVRVLLLSGRNNHEWKATTPKLEAILEPGGRFVVDILEQSEALDETTLAQYDVLLSNWNNFGAKEGAWPARTREAYLRFVRDGHGVVIVHAGSSSFNDWEDYHKIAGAAWGEGTGHGPIHTFEVKIADANHPITRGLRPFQTTDELWHRAWSIAERHVLATAFSAKDKGGSGADEPVAFTTAFGKGRCFTLLLGHDVKAMEAPGFQALLRRGTEWAATARVTLKDGTAAATTAQAEVLIASAAAYKFGDNRASLAAVEQLVSEAAEEPGARKELAGQIVAALSGGATTDAKQFFCAQLSLVGSAAEVPVLARLLSDTNLEYHARLALERIPGEEATQVLRRALASASVQQRPALIKSLGARRSPAAVPDLAPLVEDSDLAIASAAANALGEIGDSSAARVLAAADPKVPPPLKAVVAEALLRCAASLTQSGNGSSSTQILRRLTSPGCPPQVRLAASTLLLTAPGQGTGAILSALQSDDAVLRASGIQALKRSREPTALVEAAGLLPKLPSDTQLELLTTFVDRPQPGCLPAALGALTSSEPTMRRAAVGAVAVLGDSSAVPALAAFLANATNEERNLARDALARLAGRGVDEAIAEALKGAAPAVAGELVRVIVARGSGLAVSVVITQLDSPDARVRTEAVSGLGNLAGLASVAGLIDRFERTAPAELDGLQSAVAQICRRGGSDEPVQTALNRATAAKRVMLLEVLAAIGGPRPLETLTREVKSSDETVRAAAVRLLANWPDPAPLDTLLDTAASASDGRTRTLAVRGVARLAPLAKDRSVDQLVLSLTKVSANAALPEQKAIVGALGELPSVPAMKAVAAHLSNPQLADEAAIALGKILEQLDPAHRAEVRPVLEQLKQTRKGDQELVGIEALSLKFGEHRNLSLGAAAANRDGLTPDGQGGPASAAIDGKPQTYWDEVDNQGLYAIEVTLKEPARVAFLRLQGYQQHNYAPKDFEVFCDGKSVARITNAQYRQNCLTVTLPPTQCSKLELRITGYYGASPAIRELEIYGAAQ